MYKRSARSNRVQGILAQGNRRDVIGVSVLTNTMFVFQDRSMCRSSDKDRDLVQPRLSTYEVKCLDIVDLSMFRQIQAEHAASKLKPTPVLLTTGVMIRRKSVTVQAQQAA